MKSISLRFRIYLAILAAVLLIGVTGLIVIEGYSLLDAFYFIIVTIATVGYGDLHPLTPLGKILVIGIILAGVGCFVGVVANAIEYMIDMRERAQRIEKLNMIIGVFFSEVGTKLLKKFSAIDPDIQGIRTTLIVSNNWSDEDFFKANALLKVHSFRLDCRALSLEELHAFLSENKRLMLTLLENPQLFEHDRFTDLIHAVFHLSEELIARGEFGGLPKSDYDHISVDMNRVYSQLVIEWLVYMQHLKKKYPYLFSLAMRTNPFDTNASPIVG
ncbi:MAG TPA: potassium channel family protein [Methanoregula sp.]|nr:potassium channel family protein [Methanoregula sp.]